MTAQRRHPRFVSRQRVLLTANDRNELRQAWTADISKGGLFVETDESLPFGHRVDVHLETPEGTVRLSAEVVHTRSTEVAARLGLPAGVGLQFVDLGADRRRAIESYVEGLAPSLTDLVAKPAAAESVPAGDRLLTMIRRFLDAFEAEDLYRALEVSPSASSAEITDRAEAIVRMLDAAPAILNAAQASRAAHVQSLARRISTMFAHSLRRLDYDLRHGYIFARERLAEASDEDRVHMRKLWHHQHPGALAEAEKHVALALQYEGVMKYQEAIDAGHQALEHDPFNTDLWNAVDTWQARLQLANGANSEI